MHSPMARRRQAITTPRLEQLLTAYTLGVTAAGAAIMALSQLSGAEVVYTPAHQLIAPNTVVNIDLNHDGVVDFAIKNIFTSTRSSFHKLDQLIAETVGSQNQIRGAVYFADASALLPGSPISSGGHFFAGEGTMAAVLHSLDMQYSCSGPWAFVNSRYLGLKLIIKGEPHFGWARLNVQCSIGEDHIYGVLTGYAYETVPERPMLAGEEQDSAEDNGAAVQDATRSEVVPPEPLSLGRLAQGVSGLAAWRDKRRTQSPSSQSTGGDLP
jgi:hypothetical protein